MNRNNSHRQKTAGLIRYSCSVLFMLFSFCYLFFLQGEILAEAQFVYSKGITTYNLFVGAVIITVVLQIVQWIVGLASRLPSRWHALSYLPSMLMLAIVTDVDKAAMAHFSFGPWKWIAPLILCVYVLLVLFANRVDGGYNGAAHDLKSQLYPNYIILFFLILAVGSTPQTSDVYHFELKAERLILNQDYEAATRVGEKSLKTNRRLTQLRMYALSKLGQLPERLFEYPQYDGSRGLLDVTDTLDSYRVNVHRICLHLGAFCGKSIHSTERYYELMLADSVWNQHTADYYLCSLLLDKNLKEFQRQLPKYYDLSDSIPDAYNRLPKAYREALLLQGNREQALQGKLVMGTDTLATFTDADFIQQFKEYNETKKSFSDPIERVNKTHRLFGKTYWWYYDYSDQAVGELKRRR